MTGYVTGFSINIVVLMIVTQLVVYVTTRAVIGFAKIQVSGVDPCLSASSFGLADFGVMSKWLF